MYIILSYKKLFIIVVDIPRQAVLIEKCDSRFIFVGSNWKESIEFVSLKRLLY